MSEFKRNEMRYLIKSFGRKSLIIAIISAFIFIGFAHDMFNHYFK